MAAACSLAALKWKRPVFGSNERVVDMRMTTGREPITADYDVTFDEKGMLQTVSMDLHLDAGWFLGDASGDVSMAVTWSDNTFFCPSFKCNGVPYTTHTPHRTSQRAPGVVQSITAINVVCEHVARSLGLAMEDVMEQNFYTVGKTTPWGDVIGTNTFNWTLPQVWSKLKTDAQFDDRMKAIDHFNLIESRWRKRGIAMTPVKYGMGINFYKSIATVNIYGDGTVLVSHGACEIGQGLNTKVIQAVAFTLGIDMSLIRVADTETSKAPNNTGTGGSGTSECSAKAASMACQELVTRLANYRKDPKATWQDAVTKAIADGICLSAEGWYDNTDPHNSYAVYGAAVSEVEIDVLTGGGRFDVWTSSWIWVTK